MPKKIRDDAASAFGARLVQLMLDAKHPRRGAGAYLAKRYRVATVTANAWLNGEYRAETETARRIAEDHGSTFDELYFGATPTMRTHADDPNAELNNLRARVDHLSLALAALLKISAEHRPLEYQRLVDVMETQLPGMSSNEPLREALQYLGKDKGRDAKPSAPARAKARKQ